MTKAETAHLYADLAKFTSERLREFEQISEARKHELHQVANYIRSRLDVGKSARITFICTHNSRRSHLSQIYAQVAASVYGIKPVETFSGGTEATAFNPRAVESLKRAGFRIDSQSAPPENPVYRVGYAENVPAQECFSKVFDHEPNPTTGYCAVMTCSQADDACPVVIGCDLRAPIRYEDPKVADDTPQESATYDERSRQIYREMLYLMSLV